MNHTAAKDLVLEMDALWRPREDEVTPDRAEHRKRALAIEMMDAFRDTDAHPDTVRGLISLWRRRAAISPDPIEKLRRPSAWDLAALHDSTRTRAPTGATCAACGGSGQRHVTAALWRDGIVAEGLIVSCECGADRDASLDGKPLHHPIGEWQRQASFGNAKVAGCFVVAVIDVNPVYASVVAWALRGLCLGERPDDHLITEVLRAVQAEKESPC